MGEHPAMKFLRELRTSLECQVEEERRRVEIALDRIGQLDTLRAKVSVAIRRVEAIDLPDSHPTPDDS